MKAIAGTFPVKCEATRKSNVKKVNLLERLPRMVTAKIQRIRIVW